MWFPLESWFSDALHWVFSVYHSLYSPCVLEDSGSQFCLLETFYMLASPDLSLLWGLTSYGFAKLIMDHIELYIMLLETPFFMKFWPLTS